MSKNQHRSGDVQINDAHVSSLEKWEYGNDAIASLEKAISTIFETESTNESNNDK